MPVKQERAAALAAFERWRDTSGKAVIWQGDVLACLRALPSGSVQNAFISDGKGAIHVPAGANRRSVWTVASEGFSGCHFATFPRKLIEPMILAGTSARGACAECGAPWVREVQRAQVGRQQADGQAVAPMPGNAGFDMRAAGWSEVKTTGWRPTC